MCFFKAARLYRYLKYRGFPIMLTVKVVRNKENLKIIF